MSGTLFVVATPIGNLEDITLRALRVLREVSLIAAEDTRRTARLLAHHGIHTPTISFHEHNLRLRLPMLVNRLLFGERLAVVTDAGTPSVSDPGAELVSVCLERGIKVDPIPGASAFLTAAVASGFPTNPIAFLGFAPNRSSHRKIWLAELAEIVHTCVFFETPHRIEATLNEMASLLGERQIVVCRELTKIHQQIVRGSSAELASAGLPSRGEFTIVVGPAPPRTGTVDITDDLRLAEEVWHLTKQMPTRGRAAIAEVARRHGLTTRTVYAAVERSKQGTSRD